MLRPDLEDLASSCLSLSSTYLQAYTPLYLHESTPPRILTSTRHTSTNPYLDASIPPRLHTSTNPYLHASIPPRIHTSTPLYLHESIPPPVRPPPLYTSTLHASIPSRFHIPTPPYLYGYTPPSL